MAQPVLKCQHLGIQFGGLKAVDDFNMEIGESELMGLIGPNGAGKTTVFNLITGVYKPTEGSLYLNGERMNGKKTHQIVHAGIARTFQNIRLFKKMTVIENVKAAMLEELTYNMPQAIFRTKAYWQQEAPPPHAPKSCCRWCTFPARRTWRPTTCPMVSSAAWRLPARWPPT